MRKKNFPPIIDKNARVIILGSFPGEESLRQQQYYAHPQNVFWDVLGEALSVDLRSFSYPERLEALKRNRIALWDVVASCDCEGSSDSNIRNHKNIDLSILRRAPKLHTALCNGGRAFAMRRELQGYGLQVRRMPSTSPRYASMPRQEKTRLWSVALRPFIEE